MRITVPLGELRLSDDPTAVLVAGPLGSSMALSAYEPALRMGAVWHLALPSARLNPERSHACPLLFADTGLEVLLAELEARGAQPQRLAVRIAGGAALQSPRSLGRRNYLALRESLRRAGLGLRGEDVGGSVARFLLLEVGTGTVRVQRLGEGERLL